MRDYHVRLYKSTSLLSVYWKWEYTGHFSKDSRTEEKVEKFGQSRLMNLGFAETLSSWSSHTQSMDQPGKVINLTGGQLNRENEHFPVPVHDENLVSRDGFSRSVPYQPAHSLHSR